METTPLTGKSDYDEDSRKKKQFIIIGVIIALLIAIAVTVTLVVVLKKKEETDNLKDRLNSISSQLSAQSTAVVNFWNTFATDNTTPDPVVSPAGFYGTLNQSGIVVPPTTKSLLSASQNLYGYSSLLLNQGANYQATADMLFAWLTNAFYAQGVDVDYGQFYYMVYPNGTVADFSYQLYPEAFTLLALAEYYDATGNSYVDEYFDTLFDDLERNFYDSVYGGYNETYDINGNPYPQPQKTAVTHLALVHGVARCVELDNGQDPAEYPRLLDLVNLFLTKFYQPTNNYLQNTFNVDWSISGSTARQYGLELEAVHVLRTAARILNLPNITASVNNLVNQFGPVSSQEGYDNNEGGYFFSSNNQTKYYSDQVAALLGNFELYQITQNTVYLDRIQGTINFIQNKLVDTQYGEVFAAINPDGSYPLGTNKATAAKGAYYPIVATVGFPSRVNAYTATL